MVDFNRINWQVNLFTIPIDPTSLEFRMKDKYVGVKLNITQNKITRLKSVWNQPVANKLILINHLFHQDMQVGAAFVTYTP